MDTTIWIERGDSFVTVKGHHNLTLPPLLIRHKRYQENDDSICVSFPPESTTEEIKDAYNQLVRHFEAAGHEINHIIPELAQCHTTSSLEH